MKRLLLIASISFLYHFCFAQTNVSGTVGSSTNWTTQNSPYIITGDVVILSDLNIESGVTVKFDGNYQLRIAATGTLTAVGTRNDSIYFVSNTGNNWKMILFDRNSTSSKVRYASIKHADNGIYANECNLSLKNSTIDSCINGIYLEGESVTADIDYCLFSNCDYGINASMMGRQIKISNSIIRNNSTGIGGMMYFSITKCQILNNSSYGIHLENGTISECEIKNNGIGIFAEFAYSEIQNNNILNNTIGIKVGAYPIRTTINCSNIYSNTSYNLYYEGDYDEGAVDATNNYFGSNNIDTINDGIYDIYDNSSLNGWFKISPYLTTESDLQISDQSEDCETYIDEMISFGVVCNEENANFQWKKNGVNLSDNSSISGATTDTLVILNTEYADAGKYVCKVSTSCQNITSDIINLTLLYTCSDTTINDTTLYYVSNEEFISLSPITYLVRSDSLTRVKGCDSTTHYFTRYVYAPNYYTDSISVTDTLIIDITLTGITQTNNINTIKVYPNPARDYVIINTQNYDQMSVYSLEIVNTLGQTVFENLINQAEFQINVNDFGGYGTYFIKVFDDQGKLLDTRKLILQ